MSLPRYRLKLYEAITRFQPDRPEGLFSAIENWSIAYKEWELADTWSAGFREGRMTVRTIKFKNQATDLKITRVKEGHLGKQDAAGIYDSGVTGLQKRLDPANFTGGEGRASLKYDLGLHDMSASLLNPERLITHQLYGYGFQTDSHADTQATSVYVVFMPVGQMADMKVLGFLNLLSKLYRTEVPQIREYVRDIMAEITRIKYADKDDSHIGFVDIAKKSALKRKYRYGLSNADAEKGEIYTDSMRQRRIAALNYTGILESAQARALRTGGKETVKFYNEIIVAYRKNANPLFPIYTRWLNNAFQVVEVSGERMVEKAGHRISPKGVPTGFE